MPVLLFFYVARALQVQEVQARPRSRRVDAKGHACRGGGGTHIHTFACLRADAPLTAYICRFFFIFGALKMTLVMMAQGITMAFLTTGGEKTSEGEDPYSRYAI